MNSPERYGQKKNHLYNSNKGDKPPPRKGHTMIIIGKILYLYGGQLAGEQGKSVGDPYFYCLDINTFIWKKITDHIGKLPVSRTQHCMELLKTNLLVVFAGLEAESMDHSLNDIFIFNTDDHTITNPFITSPIPTPFYGAACASNKGAIIFAGGIGKEYLSIDIHKITTSSGSKPITMWSTTQDHVKKQEEVKEYEESLKKISKLIFENSQAIDKLEKEKGELMHVK